MTFSAQIPVIDLFAGPGGLGEGFSSLKESGNGATSVFRVALAIEKDPHAHETLLLRSFFRQFPKRAPNEYYKYLDCPSPAAKKELFTKYAKQAKRASEETWCFELSEDNEAEVARKVEDVLGKDRKDWVLIGGPPCQAYSVVGRARQAKEPKRLRDDPRNTLYKHYLDLVRRLRPSVFVMENVKGLLSATVDGQSIFEKILDDLACRSDEVPEGEYAIYSLVHPAPTQHGGKQAPSDYIIRAEEHGIPQARHRVILLGVRRDLNATPRVLHRDAKQITVHQVLHDLPSLASHLSRRHGSDLSETERQRIIGLVPEMLGDVSDALREKIVSAGGRIANGDLSWSDGDVVNPLLKWYRPDKRLTSYPNHEARSHMPSDLQRYLYCACFACVELRSPVLRDFPLELLPRHMNVRNACEKGHFADRFRVQLKDRPSTTITSHISKDGHYYIHPDPVQCRSLSVREAARCQTFPDDYLFEGNRTQQYQQVGNAVPPLLAREIAAVVHEMLSDRAAG